MKRLALIALSLAACKGGEQPKPPTWSVPEKLTMSTLPETATTPLAVQISDGLLGPESVVCDPDLNVCFISNVNGDAALDDDNGFITKISPSGEILDLKFIDGASPNVTLHAPRGLAISADTLYVADNHAVRLFDKKTGLPTGTWDVPGSIFLNDLTIDNHGRVVVTETAIVITPTGPVTKGPFTIYRFDTPGQPTVLARGEDLHGPNGIIATPQGLVVVEFMGDEHGVFLLDDSGGKKLLATLPYGELDGIAPVPDGSFLVTTWEGFGIYHVVPDHPEQKPTLVIQDLATPASIKYDALRKRILIPMLTANAVRIEPWVPPSQAAEFPHEL